MRKIISLILCLISLPAAAQIIPLRRCTISRFAGRSAIQSDPAQPGAVEYGIIGIEPFHPGIQGRPKNPVCAKNADQYEFPAGSFRQADIPG